MITTRSTIEESPWKREQCSFVQICNQHIDEARREKHAEHDQSKSEGEESRPSLIRCLVNEDMPESELSNDRLGGEARFLLGAGTLTVARTLEYISYHIAANESITARLSEELKDIMAQYPEESPSFTQLQQLPYLDAIVKEGLRWVLIFPHKPFQIQSDQVCRSSLSYGVVRRLPRCFPDGPLQYKQWVIPPNVNSPEYQFQRNNLLTRFNHPDTRRHVRIPNAQ